MDPLATAILERLGSLNPDVPYSTDRSFLHAYIACLNLPDLCEALLLHLPSAGPIRAALKSRLLRVVQSDCEAGVLDRFVARATAMAQLEKKLRPTVDSICSGVFVALPLPTQQLVMERWIDRGTRSALARWLKIAERHPDYFEEELVWKMWRATADELLFRSLCLQASPGSLSDALVEIAQRGDSGWMVGKAFLRAAIVSDEAWDVLRTTHPATFLYVSAKQRRSIEEEEALAMVLSLPANQYPDVLGLGIWSLGQLGMFSALTKAQSRLAT